MNCPDFQSALVDLLYGELAVEERGGALEHRKGCAKCDALARELEEARAAARELGTIPPPPELDRALALAARAEVEADVRRAPLRGGALHVAAAGLLALGLGALGYGLGTARPAPTPTPIATHETPDPGEVDTRTNGGAPSATPRPRGALLPPEKERQFQAERVEIGRQRLAAGDARFALTCFEQAWAIGPWSVLGFEARLGKGEALCALDRRKEAVEWLEDLCRDIDDDMFALPVDLKERAHAARDRARGR